MPKGMKLRSPWRATSFSSPDNEFSLDAFAATRPLRRNQPLPIEQFIAYADWFQQHLAPEVDRRQVRTIELAGRTRSRKRAMGIMAIRLTID